ncbi:hypothetical protein HBP98_16955 [Listeria booriae]|uniref:MerR family transcriptional regulator n=1 Tax=Listeria booriae TaxID=1552123 RepID=A0A7X1A9R4_9LIST|nr:hypothetical protein [Listeria booriae]MBC2373703.1 hypothetical protein [Listeria booriae]
MKKTILLFICLLVATIAVAFSITIWQDRATTIKQLEKIQKDDRDKQRTIEQYRKQTIAGTDISPKETGEDEQFTDILANNKQLMQALYTYTNIQDRLENAKAFLTKDQYQKMKDTMSDEPQEKMESQIQDLKVYLLHNDDPNQQTIINEVSSQTIINNTATPQRVYVKTTFKKQDGEWKANQFLFTAIPSQDAKQEES